MKRLFETGAALRRRRRAAVATGLVGAGFLGAGLNAPADSNRFYALTAATAATYVVGGAASGPIRRGTSRSQVILPALLGAAPASAATPILVRMSGTTMIITGTTIGDRASTSGNPDSVLATSSSGPVAAGTGDAGGVDVVLQQRPADGG